MYLQRHKNFTDKFFDYLMDLENLSSFYELEYEDLKTEIDKALTTKCNEDGYTLLHHEHREIVLEVLNNITGLGPIEPLLKDPDITDILVNGYNEVYLEKKGQLQKENIRFYNNNHVLRICQRIVSRLSGRSVDESQPLADARLADGSRVNIIISPISLNGPCISIRKFSSEFISLSHMVKNKNISQPIMDFLKLISACRLNVIVSGGTGSGKTTLLGALSEFIHNDERIITVEDAAELKIRCPHLVRLESRPMNIEGKGEITIRDLVRNALRMRPNRIIIGECRGKEAFDMLQAMNTGHNGSMSTIHANDSPEALGRLENMILMANLGLPSSAIRGFIADAIDLVIQIERMRDHHRRVVSIYEVGRYDGQEIAMNQLFGFEIKASQDKVFEGRFTKVNAPKYIVPKIAAYGEVKELDRIFSANPE